MRRFWLIISVVGGFASALACPASAADPSRPVGHLAVASSGRTQACIVSRQPDLPSLWLSRISGSKSEKKLLGNREIGFAACFGVPLATASSWTPVYDHVAMRAALVHHLLATSLETMPLDPPSGLQNVSWYGDPRQVAADKDARAGMIANELGFCLAKSDWSSVRKVIVSGPGSAAEQEGLERLVPLVEGCIPAGTKLTLHRARLRGILEETAYHSFVSETGSTLVASASANNRAARPQDQR